MFAFYNLYSGRTHKILTTKGFGELGGCRSVPCDKGITVVKLRCDDKIGWHDAGTRLLNE